jgi:filamentous hemagglutinin family protein
MRPSPFPHQAPGRRPVARHPGDFHLRPLSLALLLAWLPTLPSSALAQSPAQTPARTTLPSGMTVVQGQASTVTNGARLTITNSANALLNWQSFSIGSDAAVRFDQPNAASRVLNRVTGNDPSAIFGQLSSNGQVWLLNPNGVLFGQGARIDVAGLVASTLNIGDAQWRAGRTLLTAGDSAPSAGVVNQGELRTTTGGYVLLVGGVGSVDGAGGVRNEGVIDAPGGRVALAAGRSIDLADSSTPNLVVRVDTSPGDPGSVSNLGRISAAGGRIDLAAAIVNQSGIVRADTLDDLAGHVSLRGSGSVTTSATSLTSASARASAGTGTGGSAGTILVDSGPAGTSLLAGQWLALAESASGQGGQIRLLGERVALLDGARVDASGARGGGEVLVGGGAQGRDPTVRNARATYIAPTVHVAADATGEGNGGRIVVWGSDSARAYGHFSAQGGPAGGDGGLVETSGGWLDARPASVRTGAPKGKSGTWLLDPYDLTITDAANVTPNDVPVTGSVDPPTTYFGPDTEAAVLTSETIEAALTAGSNVYIFTTNDDTTGTGLIHLRSANINVTPTSAVSLRIVAVGSVLVDGSTIDSTGRPLDITLTSTSPESGLIRFTNGSRLLTDGTIDLVAPHVRFDTGTALTSRATGNAITLRGSDKSNLWTFTNNAGAAALNTPNGRWQIYATDPTDGESFDAGGLNHGATIYNSNYPSAADPGLPGSNLLLFSVAPQLYATGSGTALAKTYDGSNQIIVSGSGQIGGEINGDRILGFFTDANAGSGKTIELFPGRSTAQGIDLAGKPVYGYDVLTNVITPAAVITGPAFTLSGDITARPVTLSGQSVTSRTYDGTTAATLSGGSLSGLVGSETLNLSTNTNYADANAGLGKAVTGTATLADGSNGGLAGNYLLTNPAISTTGDITARPVTLSGQTVTSRTYDGTTAATLAGGSLSGLIGSQTLNVATGANYADANAGLGKAVTGTATLADGSNGGLAGNYLLTNPAISTTGDITARPVTLSGQSVTSRTYDGTTAATLSGGSLSGLVGSETLNLSTNTNYADANAGLGKAVTGTAALADGSNGGLATNYLLTNPAISTTGDITPRTVSVGGFSATSRSYDGSTTATLSGGSLTGLIDGEQLTINASGAFADRNAGSAKTVTITTALADGPTPATTGAPLGLAANYQLSNPSATTTATITPRDLVVSAAAAANKTYDGSSAATISAWQLANVVDNDLVQVGGGSGLFDSASAGSARGVTATATALAGSDAANYRLASASVRTQADIDPATLFYQASPAVRRIGEPLSNLGGAVSGFVVGETLASATTGTLQFSTPATATSPAGRYAINGSGLSAANYRFVQGSGNATALALVAPQPADQPALIPGAILPPARPSSPTDGRTLDASGALRYDADGRIHFGALDVQQLPGDRLSAILETRLRFKQSVLAAARSQLETDPTLADAPACVTLEQVDSGTCLVTEELKARARDRQQLATAPGGIVQPLPAPGPAASPAPSLSPSPSTAPPPSPSTAPATPVPGTATAALPRPATPVRPTPRRAALPQIQRKIAVVIGIDQYADTRIPSLDGARHDADAVANLFSNQLGYETVLIPDASREAILRGLNRVALQAGPSDSVIVYYAGHGELIEKTRLGYWLPANARVDQPQTWISNNDIGRLMARISASQVALISDSCFSGSLVGSEALRTAADADAAALLQRRSAVVMSSGGNEPVADSGKDGHSPFTWNLLRHLEQVSTWRPGGNVFEQVRQAVMREVPQRPRYGAALTGRHEAGGDYLFETRRFE